MRSDLTHYVLIERLIKWLAGQHEGVQLLVLGQIPESMVADVAKRLLTRMVEARANAGPQVAGKTKSQA